MRLAIEDATSMEAAAMLLVIKKMVPSSPSGRLNLRWKKYVIQDLDGISDRVNRNVEKEESLQGCQSRCKRVQSEQNEKSKHQRPQVSFDRRPEEFLLRGWLDWLLSRAWFAQQGPGLTTLLLLRLFLHGHLDLSGQRQSQDQLDHTDGCIDKEDDPARGNKFPPVQRLERGNDPATHELA